MNTYIILIRGINVGGKNRVPMTELKESLVGMGFHDVTTYIASGNVVLKSDRHADEVKAAIEAMLPTWFALDSKQIKVLVLTHRQLQMIVNNRPQGFGDEPDKYHSDAIFLIDINSDQALHVFMPREGVDKIWPGNGVIYSQRVSALRTKSRLSKIIGTSEYKSMTIRSWGTTVQLLKIIEKNS